MTEQSPSPDATAIAPDPVPTRHGKRFVILGSIVALVLVAAGAGAYAYQKLSGGGTQPSEVLPASVLAYARVDVDPSASQKIALLKLIRKFPEAAKSIGIDSPTQDVRKLLLKDAIADCGLTYDKDIKPWIGSRLGVAMLKDAETPIFALQVSDEGKARKGLKAFMTKCGDSPTPDIAFLDGYALVTDDPHAATAARAAAKKAPLSENKAFIADNKALDGEGFASAWVTAKAYEALLSVAIKDGDLPVDIDKDAFGKASTAISIRATDNTLELASVAKAAKGAKAKPSGIAKLPTNTAIAFAGMFGGQDSPVTQQFLTQLERGFDEGFSEAAKEAGGVNISPDEATKKFESATGLKFPEDVETLISGGLTLAVGADHLETIPALEGPDDVARLNIALAMNSDPDKAGDLAQRLSAFAARAGIQLTVKKSDTGAVIATNSDAAAMFDGSGKLGAKNSFTRVIPDGAKATSAFYIDVATIVEALETSGPPPEVESVLKELEAVSAVGFSASTADRYTRTSLRIAFAH